MGACFFPGMELTHSASQCVEALRALARLHTRVTVVMPSCAQAGGLGARLGGGLGCGGGAATVAWAPAPPASSIAAQQNIDTTHAPHRHTHIVHGVEAGQGVDH